MRSLALLLVTGVALAWCSLSGCSDKVTYPERFGVWPETELTYGPVEYDTTNVRVHFYWAGHDRDGEVVRFRFAMDADTALPLTTWQTTTAKDMKITVPVDPITAIRKHVFMVSSEDNEGYIDRTPARRFFSSRTIPPTSCVTRPGPWSTRVAPTFAVEWEGNDPDGGLIGNGGDVDSFQYLLLEVGALADPESSTRIPLPPYNQYWYEDIINRAVEDALPEPHGDWRWIGMRGTTRRFANMAPGEYVFAVRAIDEAGAREKRLEFGCNIRHFTVIDPSPAQTTPQLSICSSTTPTCFLPVSGTAPVERGPLEILEGETVSFAWRATTVYGGAIIGYSYALNDSSSFPPPDSTRTGVTLPPDILRVGTHFLFVRAYDTLGMTATAYVPIHVIRAAFREPGNSRSILYVDDSTAPGVLFPGQDEVTAIGNFPNDVVETGWWTLELLNGLGVPVTEWDATLAGVTELQARKPPPLRTLANYSTVIWNVDFNNTVSSPTALWRTLVGDQERALRSYLAGGGTLILTGFDVSSSTVNPNTIFDALTQGLCASFQPGSPEYLFTYVPRTLMGIDRAVLSKRALRRDGARDFISAYPTAAGSQMGLDSARVDRGPLGSGAKWTTNLTPSGDPEVNEAPGLGRVDGWVLAAQFGCAANPAVYRVEDPSRPIAEPILRYHGVPKGVNEDGEPSPREGLVVGIRVQAHDDGQQARTTYGGEPEDLTSLYGRMVHFSFPFFWLRDEDAIRAMQAAFQYVNASPTLP